MARCPLRAVPRYSLRDRRPRSSRDRPPYDVIDAAERAELAARHPPNAVHVDPVGDSARATTRTPTRGRRPRRRGIADGVARRRRRPTFYLYRMTSPTRRRARTTRGASAPWGSSARATGDVLPHERTTPKAKSDRLDLLRGTMANLSPIWGLSLADGPVEAARSRRGRRARADWTDPDGVDPRAWRVDDAATSSAIADAIGERAGRDRRRPPPLRDLPRLRDERPRPAGRRRHLCSSSSSRPDQLTVRPIHRLLAGLPPASTLGRRCVDSTYEPSTSPAERGEAWPSSRRRAAPASMPPAADVATTSTRSRLDARLAALPAARARVPARRRQRRRRGRVRAGRGRRAAAPGDRRRRSRASPTPATACRRRRRSSGPSREPGASVVPLDRTSSVRRTVGLGDVPGGAAAEQRGEVAFALLRRRRRRAGGASPRRTRAARRRGTRRSASARRGRGRGATA